MRLLIDSNILLEVLLEQEKADEARQLLSETEEYEFFVSDFSLHSIGLLLFRRQQHEVFRRFLTDMFVNAGIRTAALLATEMDAAIRAAEQFSLDFDDAHQHAVADDYALTIVSFDADFDRTERGRRTPAQVGL
jgi:predicted nucleic acid-binding protein